MRKSFLIIGGLIGLTILIMVVLVIRRSTTESRSSGAPTTQLGATLPLVSPPPRKPKDRAYDATVDEDEGSLPEDWYAKHPLYASLPAAEDGFSIQPTGKLFEIKITIEPRAPLNTPEREAELKALQARALTWMKQETLKVDPKSEAAKAYPGWAEKQPAFGFDQKRGIDDFTIIWQQSNK